ncbi:MAG: PD-(D/E)XK nuclease family protein, partial [Bryobacteraceae bacterium]|nr:PD-(D/E)XK nuclease family protein [Bryobacteraceae bacterium]
AFELSFGRKKDPEHDPASIEEPVRLFDEFLLQGSIDVVERKGEGPLRVTDYKTGRAPQPAPVYVGKGAYLQPLLYALAAEKIFDASVLGGRLCYSTLRGNYRKVDIALNEVGRQHVRQVLETIERAISEGMLPALPDKDACGVCDYLAVCGPYEAERTERKPKWRPLVELRRLP